MEIGKAIHQKKFRSTHHKAIINIMYTAGWLQHEQTKFLRPYEISPQQYNVLRILRGRFPEPASVSYIQERMLDNMSNASRLIDKLELKQLVDKKTCGSDRRQVDIFITQSGLDMLSELDQIMTAEDKKYEALTKEEADILSNLLDKLRG